MRAIILAAGEGKRLRPLTQNIPKCMVKLFGKSILEWQIDSFKSCGITDISVVTGYQHAAVNFPDIQYFKNDKFNSTNMVETLFCAREKLIDCVIISYGDIVFEKSVLEKLINSKDDCAIVIDKNWKEYWEMRFDDPLDDAESLILDENGYIMNIGQKPKNVSEVKGQYIGLMKFQNKGVEILKEFYDKIKTESHSGYNPINSKLPFEKSFMTDLLQGLINAGCKLRAVIVNNGWLELDTIHDYETYKKMYNNNNLEKFIKLGHIKK